MGRADCCIRSDFFLPWRLVRELQQMFFSSDLHSGFVPVLPCASFSRSPFCAFLLFWPAFSVHLTSLPPPSPPTTFYVSALDVFKQGDTTWTGSGRGPAHKHTPIQDRFKPARRCCIMSSSVTWHLMSALALQGQGVFFQEELAAFFIFIFTKFSVSFSLFCLCAGWTAKLWECFFYNFVNKKNDISAKWIPQNRRVLAPAV